MVGEEGVGGGSTDRSASRRRDAVIRLRLFHRDDPSRQLDSRVVGDGDVTIGRGAQADWRVEDPQRDLSRLHLTVTVRDGALTIRDTSANGVYVGEPRQRLDRDRATPVSRGEAIVFGNFLVVAEEERGGEPADPEPIGDIANPFEGGSGRDDEPAPRRADPFASALKPDPVRIDEEPGDGVDVWDRRREPAAGDWNAIAPGKRPDHAQMIGTAQEWAEPPVASGSEHGFGFDAPFTSPILRAPAAPASDAVQIPSNWDAPEGAATATPVGPAAHPSDPDPILPPPSATAPSASGETPSPVAASIAPAGHSDAGLFESFCAGARLSPDAFAGEDRDLLMQRLGAVYRQAILGVADLMSERTALKNDFRLARTTIRPTENNPFKWVPAQRIAVELLRSEDGSGYQTGERALNEALHDVKAHMLCVLAGMRAALAQTFDLLSPTQIDKRIAGRGFVMPGQRSAAAWNEFTELFDVLRREADDSAEGPINRAFREAYEAQFAELDGSAGVR